MEVSCLCLKCNKRMDLMTIRTEKGVKGLEILTQKYIVVFLCKKCRRCVQTTFTGGVQNGI